MKLEDTGKDSVQISPGIVAGKKGEETTQGDAPKIWGGGGDCLPGPGMPNPFPPKPIAPAMTIAFRFSIGEPVVVSHSGVSGAIVAAAVTFNDTTNLYLVDVGVDDGKWYPENMLRPAVVPRYYQEGPTDSPATKMSGGEETGDRPKE